ncbi:hypothetical protein OG539_02140 [Actinacidiphila glaucinigra]
MIAEFLEAFDLADVTVVANDSGGAHTQILSRACWSASSHAVALTTKAADSRAR